MAKATKKRAPVSKAKPGRRPHRSVSNGKPRPEAVTQPGTKQALAIAMLRSAEGASIPALMEATAWQQHSVRGFLAGVVRKRLGLPLESTKVDGFRVYRIAEGGGAKQRQDGEHRAS